MHDDADGTDGVSSRDSFVAKAIRRVILASVGQRDEDGSTQLAASGVAFDNPRDAALITNASAARAVLDHDEAVAAAAFDDFVARHPLDHTLGERHLRRFLALGYVLHPQVRDAWDRAEVGPSHEQARTVARALLAARRGRRPAAADGPLSPPLVCTVLPLPWSMELACRRASLGADDGSRLAAWLVDHVGQSARDELRRLAAGDDPRLAADANALLSRLPVEPADHLEIAVLGPVELRRDGRRDDPSELRRARVRELLSILVVEPDLRRERAMALLWPELDAEAGSRNLRVTLAHLRRLLEPSRPAGEAGFHLRTDGSTIRLFASPKLTVDLWELHRLAAEGTRARNKGDIHTAVELLEKATSFWRGTPLTDLDRLPGFGAPIEEARLLQVSSLLALGELRLTEGRAGLALGAAERALGIDPYREQAHRLAIAAHIQRHDPAGIAAASRRVVETLADLGVDPEPATVMMLRNASAHEERWPAERTLVAAR
jgi:LuxR family maltose regulon positive regulatory protein